MLFALTRSAIHTAFAFRTIRTLTSKMTTTIGVVQLQATADKEQNFTLAQSYIKQAVSDGAKMVFLPECFDFIGSSREETLRQAEPMDGPLVKKYKQLAVENQLWISLGGAHRTSDTSDDDRVYNTHIVIDDQGQIAGHYDKIHMFDANIAPSDKSKTDNSSHVSLTESRTVRPGNQAPKVIQNTPVGPLGLAIMVFLPECFDFIGSSREETLRQAEPMDGPLVKKYKQLAVENQLWISLGGAHRTSDTSDDDRVYNTHIVIDDQGQIAGHYDKIHMFDANIAPSDKSKTDNSSHVSLTESRTVRPGNQAPKVIQNTPVGPLGLAICYDMRFPELASHLRYTGGAHLLAYPSAFSTATGRAGHWHTLLRARAIETQCYVIAAAQEGEHNPKRSSYGHSLVIDPWGKIIAEQSTPGPGLLMCHLPISKATDSALHAIRRSMPVESHRRFDLFPMQDAGHLREIGSDDFQFGPHQITAGCVFYRSSLSFAFVNISPLVPGHILVCPIAQRQRFDDLSAGEVADLYLTVQKVAAPLTTHFQATSLTISIQDGTDAGQSVPHVHVHVLPRKPGDFSKNDDIYSALQAHDKVANRVYRSELEMHSEAQQFRRLFS